MKRNIWNTDMDGIDCAIHAEDYFHSQTYHNCTFKASDEKMLRADSKFVRVSFYCRNNPAVFQRTHVELRPGLEGWVIEFIPDKEEFWTVLEPPWLAFIKEQELVFGYTFTKVDIDNEGHFPTHVTGADTEPVAEIQSDSKQESKRSITPNIDTEYKIERLIKYRQKEIKRTGKAPKWMKACSMIPIDPKTVTTYAYELRKKWSEIEFQPEPNKYNIF